MGAKRGVSIGLVVAVTLALILTVVFNYLSTSDLGRKIGLFSNNSRIPWSQRGHLNDSSLTPPGFAFGIWGVIYAYQAATLVYCWTLLFRRSQDGEFLCCVPGLLPVGFLVCHAVSSLFNIAWVILADKVDLDKPLLVPQTVAIYGLAVALWAALAFSFAHLSASRQSLVNEGLSREYWLVVGLVQNSVGMYAGWVSVASYLNLDIALINLANYPIPNSALFCLANFSLILGAYVAADFSFLDPVLRFVFTPYVSILWALATSLSKHYEPDSPKSALTAELVAGLVAVLLAKVVAAVWRQKRRPILGRPSRVNDSGLDFAKLKFNNS